jgi:Immunoglobulin-like domain of bacterial spore germination
MTDDDQLRRLLSDAVSDIEPRDRLAEIRASVHPDPQVVPMSRPRPWLYALSGAVASAAVIGVIAYTTNALSGPDGDGGVDLGAGQASDGTASSRASTSTATDSAAPYTSSSAPSSAPVTTGAKAYAVYYVGANGAGKPVLFREWHRGPDLPTTDPAGHGGDVLTEAVGDAIAALPLDPDYRTPWHDLATLDHASYDGTGAGGTLQIALDDTRIADRPVDMTAAEARAAVQQLVYTAQAAVGKRVPVVFTVGRRPPGAHPTLLGVDISRPVANAPVLSTLSLVNISSPSEGAKVSGPLTVTGVNNAFEGNVVVYLERNGRKYLQRPTTGGQGLHKLFPWTVTLDLTKVQPGEYTLVARNGNGSGRGQPDVDTRTIEVK